MLINKMKKKASLVIQQNISKKISFVRFALMS